MLKKSILNNKIIEKAIENNPVFVLIPIVSNLKHKNIKTKHFSYISTRIKKFDKSGITNDINFPSSLIFFSTLSSLIKYNSLNNTILLFQFFNFFIKSKSAQCVKLLNYEILAFNLFKSLQRSLFLLKILSLKK